MIEDDDITVEQSQHEKELSEQFDKEVEQEDTSKCPDCGSPVIEKWSGVKCSNPNCDWWFCF